MLHFECISMIVRSGLIPVLECPTSVCLTNLIYSCTDASLPFESLLGKQCCGHRRVVGPSTAPWLNEGEPGPQPQIRGDPARHVSSSRRHVTPVCSCGDCGQCSLQPQRSYRLLSAS